MKTFILRLTTIFLIPLTILSLFLIGYANVSDAVGGVGYGYGHLYLIKFEYVFAALIYYTLFVNLRKRWYRYVVALLPIALFYVFYDYYYLSFGEVFKVCNLSELPELLDVLPIMQIVGYLSIFAIMVFFVWESVVFKKRLGAMIVGLALIVTGIATYLPGQFVDFYKDYTSLGVTAWGDKETAGNGYMISTLYFQAMMKHARKMATEQYADDPSYEDNKNAIEKFVADKGNKRNVHVVILESFFNPKQLELIHYNHDVYDKAFADIIQNKENIFISPVFGGYTAQAEFEFLCGVPALHKYDTIEFNGFSGEPAHCLPDMLHQVGYRAMVSNGYKPSFFNAMNAYRGAGFDEIYFPKQYAPARDTYLKLVDDSKYIFDGDFLEQNLAFVKKHLAEPNHAPLFNYVLGVYGHLPFQLDEKRHPKIIKATTENNKLLNDEYQNATNQIHYRTQAIAHYLQELMVLDPNSLIILSADHLPRLGGVEFYKKMNYRHGVDDAVHKVPSFYIVNGKAEKLDEMHEYGVMDVIFNYLTDQQYCTSFNCKRDQAQVEEDYNKVMSRALR